MSRLRVLLLMAVLAGGLCAPAAARADLALPPGFEERELATGLDQPTAVAWTPDGRMLVAEKMGRIRIVSALGVLSLTPLIDLRAEVSYYADRGLLGLAVDADFAANGYVYALYTYEHDVEDWAGPKTSRLERLTLAGNRVVARRPLLGTVNGPGCPPAADGIDCLPSEGSSHSIGTVRAAPDGTLWVGSGDAASFARMDRLALRTFDERSMAGKILHVDRQGRGLPGHPFCPGTADLDAVCAKVAAAGFRNPFRFVLRDGLPLVGDVGWNEWEELDVVAPGRSYGWPCHEGASRTPLYADLPECAATYARAGTTAAERGPVHAYPHTDDGGSVQAGPQYTGDQYPAALQGSWFVADYGQRWIRHYTLDAQGRMTGAPKTFATNYGGVDLETSPSGDLVWVDIESGSVRQVVYSPGNATPVARPRATPAAGAAPLRTRLTAVDSTDPDGDPLAYEWDFGDGSPPSTERDPTHTYAVGDWTATLTVDDGRGRRASRTVAIAAGNTPPEPRILAPADNASYRDGGRIALSGEAVDAQDGRLAGARLTWRVTLRHGTHLHPVEDLTGAAPGFVPFDDHDADAAYVVALTARDAGGLAASTSITLRPETAPLTLSSEPTGAMLSFGGVEFAAPRLAPAAVGYRTTIGAEPSFVRDGATWAFDRWSDGGERAHDIVVAPGAATLTARYRPAPDPPDPRANTGDTRPDPAPDPAPAPAPAPAGGASSSGPFAGGPARVALRRPWRGRSRAPVRSLTGRLTGTPERLGVQIAVARPWRGSRAVCQWWNPRRRGFGAPARCSAPAHFAANVATERRAGGWSWRAALGARLPRGTYRYAARTLDGSGRPARAALGELR